MTDCNFWVSDDEIKRAFENAAYNSLPSRQRLERYLFRCACGRYVMDGSLQVLKELDLIMASGANPEVPYVLTLRGREYLYQAYAGGEF